MPACLLLMRQAWQVGFKSFRIPLGFAGAQKTLKLDSGSAIAFRMSANSMGSERLLSDSSKPVPLIVYKKKGKKSNALVCDEQNSSKILVKKDGVEVSLDLQSIKDDLARIEAMTFQELRATLKRFGLPAKGCKADLISALKSHVNEKIKGQVSGEVEETVSSSSVDHISAIKSRRKSDDSGMQSIKTVSEVSNLQKSKRLRQSVGDKEITMDANRVASKQMLSVETDKQTGKKNYHSKTKSSSDVVIEEAEVNTKVNLSVDQAEPWTILAHKKPQNHWNPYNPRTMRPPPLSAGTRSIKLISWNVNGLRALLKMEGFSALELAKREEFDVLCLQETKLQEKDVDAIKNCLIDGYDNSFWICSVSKLGYSGTAIISRIKPLSVKYGLGIPDHDSEGRLVTAEFDSFYLLSGYVPNSGDGLRRLPYRISQWDPSLGSYIKELEKSKPVILTGDLNCAHQEIDIYDPAGNKRSAGFTIEERQSFEANFLSKGMVDTFRRQHPDVVGYTYWGFRHGGRKTNKGWRLDYFLVSESIVDQVHDSYILPDIVGSDHCPIGLILKI